MPSASRATTPVAMDLEMIEGRYALHLVAMVWAAVLFLRVLPRESSEAAAKNPRPW